MADTNFTGRIKVTVKKDGQPLQQYNFDEFPVVIGRNPECKLRFTDSPYVSRVHSSIALNGDEIIVKDLGSTNGIKVDGHKLDLIRKSKSLAFFIESLEFQIEVEAPEVASEEMTSISVIRTKVTPPQPSPLQKIKPLSTAAPQPEKPAHSQPEKAEDPAQFTIAPFYNINKVPASERILQVVMTWEDDVHSICNFQEGEPIILGNKITESIYLPTVTQSVNFGLVRNHTGIIRLAKAQGWNLFSDKKNVTHEEMIQAGQLSKEQNTQNLLLKMGPQDVLSLELGNSMYLHFRYVKRPAYYLPKTLIENRDEAKRALSVSALVHIIIAVIALIAAPKNIAPRIDNVPPRVAKLLVEPPVQLLAKPEPPPLPPEPEPPAPPPTTLPPTPTTQARVRREPPKPTPQPVQRQTPPKPQVQRPTPPRPTPQRQNIAKVPPRPQAEKRVPTPPQPTAAQRQAEQLAQMLGQLPGPPAKGPGTNTGAPIQIDRSNVSPAGVRVSGVTSAANQARQQGGVVGGGSPQGFNVSKGGTGAVGFSKQGQQGTAGRRNVVGAVVGTPALGKASRANQGLPNNVIMSVVNRHLGDIQRCYERALFEDGSLKGRVEYEWVVEPAGNVSSARVVSSQMARSDTLNNCVMGVFRRMRFPNATNGQPTLANIGFPFGQ